MLSAAGSRRARSLPPTSYSSGSLSGILSGGAARSTRFGPLRPSLARTSKEGSTLGRGRKAQRYPVGVTRRTNGLHKMEGPGKKRIPDYTDTAYREAVSRLRYLLAESYSSPHRAPFRGLSQGYSRSAGGEESGGEETDAVIERTRALLSPYRRPLYTPARRNLYTARSPSRVPSVHVEAASNEPTVHTAPTTPRANTGTESAAPLPPEMMTFIERQEEYIDQLERESHFCREELSSLLGKVKEVISENEGLQEKNKSGVLKSVLDYLHSDNEDEEEEDEDTEASEVEPRRKKRERRHRLEGPSIMFESRISELEAQLTQVRIELKKAQDEADLYKKRLAGEGLLGDIGAAEPDSLRHQMESLKREKEELGDAVSKLQSTVSQLRERENDATHRLKRSQEAVEQATFEKSQGELEVRRLKDELDRLHAKLREAVTEQGRRAAEERASVERRFQQQVETLQADLTAQWDASGRLQLDLEKQRRTEAELRREIANKNATLDDMAKETQAKIDVLQGELGSALSHQGVLGQELAAAQLVADRAEREGRQESKRLGAEVSALRERLDRADSETLRARQEALRLSEQLATLDREMTLSKTKGSTVESRGDVQPAVREQELTSMISNMEEKHVETVAELEGMIQSQNQVMAQLKDECHNLTQRLEDSSARHKQERVSLREENSVLLAGCTALRAEYHELLASSQRRPVQTWRATEAPARSELTTAWGQWTDCTKKPPPPGRTSPRSTLPSNPPPEGTSSPPNKQEMAAPTRNLQKSETLMKLVKETNNLNRKKVFINHQHSLETLMWMMSYREQETMNHLGDISSLQGETPQCMSLREWTLHQSIEAQLQTMSDKEQGTTNQQLPLTSSLQEINLKHPLDTTSRLHQLEEQKMLWEDQEAMNNLNRINSRRELQLETSLNHHNHHRQEKTWHKETMNPLLHTIQEKQWNKDLVNMNQQMEENWREQHFNRREALREILQSENHPKMPSRAPELVNLSPRRMYTSSPIESMDLLRDHLVRENQSERSLDHLLRESQSERSLENQSERRLDHLVRESQSGRSLGHLLRESQSERSPESQSEQSLGHLVRESQSERSLDHLVRENQSERSPTKLLQHHRLLHTCSSLRAGGTNSVLHPVAQPGVPLLQPQLLHPCEVLDQPPSVGEGRKPRHASSHDLAAARGNLPRDEWCSNDANLLGPPLSIEDLAT